MKKTVAILVLIVIAGIAWGQALERYTSVVLWFDLRSTTDIQMQKHLDSYLYQGFTIASTAVYGDNIYIFLQARLK